MNPKIAIAVSILFLVYAGNTYAGPIRDLIRGNSTCANGQCANGKCTASVAVATTVPAASTAAACKCGANCTCAAGECGSAGCPTASSSRRTVTKPSVRVTTRHHLFPNLFPIFKHRK